MPIPANANVDGSGMGKTMDGIAVKPVGGDGGVPPMLRPCWKRTVAVQVLPIASA